MKLMNPEDIVAQFPGSRVEPKWNLPDCIHTGPLFAMYLLLGGRPVKSPHGRDTHTSIVIDGNEYVLTNEDFEFSQKLASNYITGFLDRHGYTCTDKEALWKLHSAKPSMIVNAIRWMQEDAFATYDIDEYRHKVFWLFPDEGACGWYRSQRPQEYMDKFFKDDFHSDISSFINYKAMTYYDAMFYNRIPTHHIMAMMQNLKLENKVMVWETDDDLLNIPDWSVSKLLVPQDLKDLFVASRDLADIIFTTNETLKERIGRPEITYVAPNLIDTSLFTSIIGQQRSLQKQYVGFKPKRVRTAEGNPIKFVNANGKFMDQEFEDKIESEYKPVRILWSGSNTHDLDLEQIVPAVKVIGEEFGIAVKFFFFGYCPPGIAEIGMLPGNTAPELRVNDKHGYFVEFIPGVPLKQFPEMLRRISPDINLCPIAPHPFNECKSNIKPLEVGAMGVPSIVSDFGPYKFIKHKCDGYKIEHSDDPAVLSTRWAAAIRHLITNKQEREYLGANIQKRVTAEFSWQTDNQNRRLWDGLFNVVKDAIAKRKQENLLRTGPMFPASSPETVSM